MGKKKRQAEASLQMQGNACGALGEEKEFINYKELIL
jgi:hypothetical protein